MLLIFSFIAMSPSWWSSDSSSLSWQSFWFFCFLALLLRQRLAATYRNRRTIDQPLKIKKNHFHGCMIYYREHKGMLVSNLGCVENRTFHHHGMGNQLSHYKCLLLQHIWLSLYNWIGQDRKSARQIYGNVVHLFHQDNPSSYHRHTAMAHNRIQDI